MNKFNSVAFKGFNLFIFLFMPFLTQAQFHDILQRGLLKSLAIQRIEKWEIDSDAIPHKTKLVSIDEINKEGFIVKTNHLGENGEVKSRYEHFYLGDTLLIKSHWYQDHHPTEREHMTEYAYNSLKQLSECRFYNGKKLVSSIVYIYSKDGRLEKQKQTWYGDKSKGSNSGKGVRTFKYNAQMLVEEIVMNSRIKGKKKKEIHRFAYDDKGNHLSTTIFDKKHPEGFRMNHKSYDEKNRLVFEETYFRSDTKMHIGGNEIGIPAGEQLERGYTYNAQGLKDEEWQSMNGKRFQEIKYIYIK